MWLYLALGSALFLGLYDIAKKKASENNGVLQVLFVATALSTLFLIPWLFKYESDIHSHLLLLIKAIIVTTSWAEPIENVRVGFIGLGMRGPGAVMRFTYLENATIVALCDLLQDRVEAQQKALAERGVCDVAGYWGEDAWMQVCDRDDIDLIYLAVPWQYHTKMAVYAMEHGKHVAVEVSTPDNPSYLRDECSKPWPQGLFRESDTRLRGGPCYIPYANPPDTNPNTGRDYGYMPLPRGLSPRTAPSAPYSAK